MHCKEIMSRDVQWILPRATVASIAKLMAFHNVGMLPVCTADGRPIGVITDRDIALRVIGSDRPATQTVAEDVMSAPARSVAGDVSVDRIGEIMSEAKVSRLLVVDEGGHLTGVVSVADLFVHAPGKNALEAARGIHAREMTDRSKGRPHQGVKPNPEYFHAARDLSPDSEKGAENSARIEANSVVHGGTNELKEFPA